MPATTCSDSKCREDSPRRGNVVQTSDIAMGHFCFVGPSFSSIVLSAGGQNIGETADQVMDSPWPCHGLALAVFLWFGSHGFGITWLQAPGSIPISDIGNWRDEAVQYAPANRLRTYTYRLLSHYHLGALSSSVKCHVPSRRQFPFCWDPGGPLLTHFDISSIFFLRSMLSGFFYLFFALPLTSSYCSMRRVTGGCDHKIWTMMYIFEYRNLKL